MSYRAAETATKVDKMTIKRYEEKFKQSGQESIDDFNFIKTPCHTKIFSKEQELALEQYIVDSANLCMGMGKQDIMEIAYEYAKIIKCTIPQNWEDNKAASKDWYYGFMSRHSDLSLRTAQNVSMHRILSFNQTNVRLFYENLEKIMKKYNFSPERIYNLDESSSLTVHGVVKIVARRGVRHVGQATSAERGVLCSLVGIVNAAGESLPPVYVFPRVNFKEHMMTGAPKDSLGLAHKSGYMVTELFLKVLQHIASNTKCTPENPVLLILDGHASHVALEVILKAKELGIILLTLPPHCSHKMQPLDVSVFGPYKKLFKNELKSFMAKNKRVITIYDIAEISRNPWYFAASPENIKNGFKSTGIHPFNPTVFSQKDFAASKLIKCKQ